MKVSPLSKVRQLLGENAFLVPCAWGTKKPSVPYTLATMEDTQSPGYVALLEREAGNIAVYLGEASSGLCAIDLDGDDDLTTFLALNPKLQNTTRSRGSRGGMVWVRILGDYPESCSPDHKRFEWRANRRLSTIYGRHPKGMDYVLLVDQPPVSLAFADIVWPAEWELPWVEAGKSAAATELKDKYGEPFYTNMKGSVVRINDRYWAGLYARENRLSYDPEEKTFYRYGEESGLWLPITHEKLREGICARMLEASREPRDLSLEAQITQANARSIATALMGIVEKRGAFQQKKPFIHVRNGIISFAESDVTLSGFSPELYSRNRSPFDFNAEAECPRFLNELIYPAMDAEDAGLLQRYFGLVLYGYNLVQRFLILDGQSNGGKGTIVRILQALVGPENCYQLRTEQLHERFETFRYRNKTLLIGADVPGDFLTHKGASMIKVLVGGDPISGEGKGLNGDFAMHGTFNIVITCNSRLRIRLEDDNDAWRRRVTNIRFAKSPPARRILDFDKLLLREEGSGILRWALAGFAQAREEFQRLGDFQLSEAQRARTDSLLAESDSLRLFIGERVKKNGAGDITTAELNQAYVEFCADRGWTPLPISLVERKAADLMLERHQASKCHNIDRDGRRSNRGWRRVSIVGAAVQPPEEACLWA